MSIIGTATNSSPYLAAPAAAAIENGKNHFVTLGENGVSLATEGVAAVGILLPDTEDKVAAGEGVTVQRSRTAPWSRLARPLLLATRWQATPKAAP